MKRAFEWLLNLFFRTPPIVTGTYQDRRRLFEQQLDEDDEQRAWRLQNKRADAARRLQEETNADSQSE